MRRSPRDEKLALLDLLEAELLGKGDSQPEAVNLRRALAERAMPPRHALDVLIAFRMDVTKLRYENWDEVIHYCRYSAMPVGRFMLDVHGESTSTWAASDALCAGLQINNHLQDCGKDYSNLNRVYLPRDALAAAGASVEELGEARASPPLLQCLHALAVRTEALLDESKSLSAEVKDFRLGLEISVIQAFADKIVRHAEGARSPERAGASRPARTARSQPRRASPARWPAARWDGGPCPNRRPAHDARGGGQPARVTGQPRPAVRSTRRCASCRASSARRCSRSTAFAGRSTTSPIPTGRGRERLAALQQWRDDIDALYQGHPPPRLRDYAASVRRFDLKREDFLAIVDGMEMDVPQDIRAPDLATLDLYCDRVASAVGRLSVRVFGLAEDDGILLAHHLGRALQLTNILRDIDEDAGIGRLYLPREGLLHAGITATDPAQGDRRSGAAESLRAAGRAGADAFREGRRDHGAAIARRVVRAPRIMSKYYRAILELLVARGFAAPRAPVRLNKMARIAIVLRYAFI